MTGFGQVLWRLGLGRSRQQVVVDPEPRRGLGCGRARRTIQLISRYPKVSFVALTRAFSDLPPNPDKNPTHRMAPVTPGATSAVLAYSGWSC